MFVVYILSKFVEPKYRYGDRINMRRRHPEPDGKFSRFYIQIQTLTYVIGPKHAYFKWVLTAYEVNACERLIKQKENGWYYGLTEHQFSALVKRDFPYIKEMTYTLPDEANPREDESE